MFIYHKKRNPRRHIILSQIILGVIIFTSSLFINSVSAVSHGGIGGRPAYPREDNSRTESIFIHTLEAGAVKEEGVLNKNKLSGSHSLTENDYHVLVYYRILGEQYDALIGVGSANSFNLIN